MSDASLRYVIVSMHGTTRSNRTEYIRGRNSRSEYRPQRTVIQNRDLGYVFQLDPESRVYTAFEWNEYRRPGWFERRVNRPRPSGRTVQVRTETMDTGERKEMFGYTARRVIIRTSHRYTPDDESRSGDSETEGWYIDHPAWLAVHPPLRGHAILQVAVNGKTDTPVFTDVGPRETGFPLLVTRIHRSNFKDAEGNLRIHTSEDRDEVIEFFEEPLATELFLPPPDFRRVPHLPGEMSLPLGLRVRHALRRYWRGLFH